MALFFKVKFFPHIFSFAPAGMYWQNVERLRENVAVMCTAVWILEVVASLRHGKRSNLSADAFCQQSKFPQKISL